MAKKTKPSVDKIVKKVNKEFDRTSSQIESLINDALKQFDSLQNQIQEPVRKLLRDMDDLREREMKRFNEEFDRRLSEFHDLQDSILGRLGLPQKERKSAVKEPAKPAQPAGATPARPAAAKAPAQKAAPKKKTPAKPAAKPAAKAAPKAVAKPAAKTPAKTDNSDLTRVKGIGPATAAKLKDLGITSVDQIANPSDAEKEKMAAFSKMKGFATWGDEAKKLL